MNYFKNDFNVIIIFYIVLLKSILANEYNYTNMAVLHFEYIDIIYI